MGMRQAALHRARLRRRLAAAVMPLFVLVGCASDYAPRNNAPAADATYRADLDSCRSDTAASRTSAGAEGFLVGALLGAAHGAAAGAQSGDADIGAIVGASVGAVAGFVHGLKWSRGASVSACMRAKGYHRV